MPDSQNTNNQISSDIYELNSHVDSIRKNFTPDVESDIMMLGAFGYYDQNFANLFQNSIIMASEFSNESIANKAKFEKNIIGHALGLGLTDINAVPASIDVLLTFIEDDIENATKTNKDKPWSFTFDKEHSIYFGDHEFHPDYDIIINKVKVVTAGPDKDFAYTARYNIDIDNNISSITNPYLAPPILMKLQGLRVIMIQCKLHQVTRRKIESKVLSDNSISSKVITFNFDGLGQLADFTIDVDTGNGTIHMVPVYEGLTLLAVNTKYPYFYYTYLDSTTIRVKFDRNSFVPKISNNITINIQTTEGTDGNFNISDKVWPAFNFSSDRFGYSNIACEVRPVTCISSNGSNKKTITELKKIIPKEALSRGSITNLTDLQNYFNVVSSMGQLHLFKKRDNALERLYYTFMVLKNSMNVIVPTNTIDIKVNAEQLLHENDCKWVFKRGTYIRYNRKSGYGFIADNIDPNTGLPTDFDENSYDDFLYMIPYNFSISKSPLYGMYYLTTINETKQLEFTKINEECVYQYIATFVNFRRGYINNPDKYILTLDVQQNVVDPDNSLVTYSVSPDNDPNFVPQIIDSKVKCYMIFFSQDGGVYKWSKAKLINFSSESGNVFSFQFTFNTSDIIDIDNRIKINGGLYNPGDNNETYGFFKSNTSARIYIISDQEENKGLNDGNTNLASIIPDISPKSSWTNTYDIIEGLDFFYDFSEIITSTIIAKGGVEIEEPEEPEEPDIPVTCNGCSSNCEGYCTSCTDTCAGSCVESCANDCTGLCEDSCANDCVGGCKDSCTGTCTDTCEDTCTGGCKNSCVNLCGGSCTGGCTTTCASDCTGTCKGTSVEITCSDCTGSCSNSCTNSCTGTCIGDCRDDCTSGCVGTCSGGCSGSCIGGCGNSCSNSDSIVGGNPSCGGDCVISCSGFCIDSCAGTCSNTETDGSGGITDKKFSVKIEGAPVDENGRMLAKVIINGLEYQGPHTFKINEGTKIEFWIYNPLNAGFVEIDGTKFQIGQIITLNDNYTIGLGAIYNGKDKPAGTITVISDTYANGGGSAGCNNSCTLGCSNTCTSSCTNTCTGTDEGIVIPPEILYTVKINGSPAIDITDGEGNKRRLELAYVIINNKRYQGNRVFNVRKDDIVGLGIENEYGNGIIRVNNIDVSNDFYNLKIQTNTEINLNDVGLGAMTDGIISATYDPAAIINEINTFNRMTAYSTRVSSRTSILKQQIDNNFITSDNIHEQEQNIITLSSATPTSIVKSKLAMKYDIKNEVIKRADMKNSTIPYQFIIRQVPVIKYDYFGNDENIVDEFCNELVDKKSYIDYAIDVLEDAFGIDFKFFNTYGPGVTSSIDEEGIDLVNRTCISLTFKLKLTTNYDTNIINDILSDIKEEVENIEEINSLHIPNLITNITKKYREFIIYFEFVDMNGYGPGVQHIYSHNPEDGLVITPELININTNKDGTPDIKLILV